MNCIVRSCIAALLLLTHVIHTSAAAHNVGAINDSDTDLNPRTSHHPSDTTNVPGVILKSPVLFNETVHHTESKNDFAIHEVSIWTLLGFVFGLGLLRLFSNSKKHLPVIK